MKQHIHDFLDDCIENSEAVFSKDDFIEFLLNDGRDSEDALSDIFDMEAEGLIEKVNIHDMNPDEQRALGLNPDCEDSWCLGDVYAYRVIYEIEKPKKK